MATEPDTSSTEDIENDGNGAQHEETDLSKALADLKKQLEAEKMARAAAESKAFEASKREFHAKGEVDETNIRLIENAIDVVKGNNQQLKQNLAAAMANQDFATVAEIQEALASNAAKLGQLEDGKIRLENAPKKQPPVIEDKVEALAVQLSPRAAAWIRAHPEYARNERLYQKMLGAHNVVSADGVEPDSDEYFSGVENVLGITKSRAKTESEDDEDPFTEGSKASGGRNASPAAAPVSRSMNYSSGGSTPRESTRVRLTPAQVEAARESGLTEKEYYSNYLALKRDGRVN